MPDDRADARRAGAARSERHFATPVPVLGPVVATLFAVLVTVAAMSLFGRPLDEVLTVAAGVLVVCSLVAHRTVSSTFAGLALLLIRPYAAGEKVRIQPPSEPDPIDAVVVHIGIGNTTLAADSGVLVVPNDRLLRNPPTPVLAERSAETCS